jgi:hypothetical protein
MTTIFDGRQDPSKRAGVVPSEEKSLLRMITAG